MRFYSLKLATPSKSNLNFLIVIISYNFNKLENLNMSKLILIQLEIIIFYKNPVGDL